MSLGYRYSRASSTPIYIHTVVDIMTSTIVERTHMFASPAAFRFIRYIIPETEVKCLA